MSADRCRFQVAAAASDLVRQEIWAYLLTHWALATLIRTAATAAGVDPDRIKFLATLRIVRRSVTDRAAFPP